MDLVPLLIIGFVAGLASGAVIGGPATGYLASIVVGVAGAVVGAWLCAALGISGPVDDASAFVVAVIGSVAIRLAMRAAGRMGATPGR